MTVETLERAYSDRADAKARGVRGAAFMADFTWQCQIGQILSVIDELQVGQ